MLLNKKNLVFTANASNPTLPNLGECDLIMQDDGITCDAWIRRGFPSPVYYRTANNDNLDNWTPEVVCTGIPVGLFPTVLKIGSTYYMFHRKDTDLNMYLYSSVNKTDWTVMNAGNPVITHSNDGAKWHKTIFNTSAWVIGTKIHILLEGAADTGEFYFPSVIGYAVADISNPVFTLNDIPVIKNGVCPTIVFSEKHNSIAVMYSEFNIQYSTPPTQYMAETRCLTASMDSDLTISSSWKKSDIRFPEFNENPQIANIWEADFSIIFAPLKSKPMHMFTCHDQSTGYQWTAAIKDEQELYNSIKFAVNPK